MSETLSTPSTRVKRYSARPAGDRSPRWLPDFKRAYHPMLLAERDRIGRMVARAHADVRIAEACDHLDDLLNEGYCRMVVGILDHGMTGVSLVPNFQGEKALKLFLAGRF